MNLIQGAPGNGSKCINRIRTDEIHQGIGNLVAKNHLQIVGQLSGTIMILPAFYDDERNKKQTNTDKRDPAC